ncbi:MAG: YopX family protein [Firmicutes bacterium]|nr:YopX family protein [Bacillota bacterium]
MNREILFRGKQIDNGKWVEGVFGISNKNQATIITSFQEYAARVQFTSHKVDHATVGQFTGLHDKNGKRVFEGDIVKMAKHNYSGVITFKLGTFYIKWSNVVSAGKISFWWNSIEIIGNIHDNPELDKPKECVVLGSKVKFTNGKVGYPHCSNCSFHHNDLNKFNSCPNCEARIKRIKRGDK